MNERQQVELIFEPQDEGGFTVYSPELPGLITEGDDLKSAERNAQEALELYVESMRDRGQPLGRDIVRRVVTVPA
jgi:predicted RNase H-like HicB family nuclease